MRFTIFRSPEKSLRLLTVFAVLALLAATAAEARVFVNGRDTTPDDTGCGTLANPCNTIQTGVDNAAPGDNVYVKPGKYYESVTVDKDNLTLTKWPLKRGKVVIDPEDVVPACDDPTRTIFTGGPHTSACRQFDGDQASCEAAYAVSDEAGAVSCWWESADSTCRGCAPNNEEAGNCTDTCGGGFADGIIIEAVNVSVKKVSIINGRFAGIRVLPGSTGAVISGLKASGADGDCVNTMADGTSVIKSQLIGCGDDCIEAQGENFTAEGNKLKQCGGNGILSSGSNAAVRMNIFLLCDEDCIAGFGDGTVSENVITGSDDGGITWHGQSMIIEDNTASYTADEVFEVGCVQSSCADPTRTVFAGGPYTSACRQFDNQADCETAWARNASVGAVTCFWDSTACLGCAPNNQWQCTNTCEDPSAVCTGRVARNEASFSLEDEGFYIFDYLGGLTVRGNTGRNCNDEGFNVMGEGITLVNNRAVGNGAWSAPGFRLDGTGFSLTGNVSIGNHGDGFIVFGNDHVLESNTARANMEDGFDVEDAANVDILNNTSLRNYGIGIEISVDATSTEVTGNTASGNRTDFCDEGTGTVESGNTFGTTGPCGVEGDLP